jgi:hypothetical protein
MEEDLGFTPPFTLGHENAGWVSAVGEGVMGFKDGDAVAVYGPWGCGHCHACQLSMENYCENWAQMKGFGGGLGLDGGMAEYMLVPSARLLVPLGDLSPAKAAPLSDAALTPYHATTRANTCVAPLPFSQPRDSALVGARYCERRSGPAIRRDARRARHRFSADTDGATMNRPSPEHAAHEHRHAMPHAADVSGKAPGPCGTRDTPVTVSLARTTAMKGTAWPCSEIGS